MLMLWWRVPGDEGRRGWQEDEQVDKTTPTRWTRVWAKPPLGRRTWLQFTGSWGAGHDLAAKPPAPPRWLSGQESTCPRRQDPQEMGVWSLMLRMTSSGNSSVFQDDSIKNSSRNSQFLHLLPEIKHVMLEGFYPFWQFQTPWTQKNYFRSLTH